MLLLLLLSISIIIWRIKIYKRHALAYTAQENKDKAIPVTLVTAKREIFPIYLYGLGTVQAYRSVQVMARVDGQIQEICFFEGKEIKEGDIIAVIDPHFYQTRHNKAVARKLQTQAQLESARIALARQKKLLAREVVDQQSCDTQQCLVAQLEAAAQADEAHLENQKIQLKWTRILAPISGYTGIRKVDVGNVIAANTTIVTINQMQPIYISFALPQRYLGQVRKALIQSKQLKVFVLDQNSKTVLSQGTLMVVDNQIDPATATFRLKAIFENTDFHLWPGQFVNVRLLVEEIPNSIVVPTEVIQLGSSGSYVYVVNGNRAIMRTVVTGPAESGHTLIQSGLSVGEHVVLEGQYRLQQNSPVNTTLLQEADAEANSH